MATPDHSVSPNAPHDFYVAGGTLRGDAPSYIPRQADEHLYAALSNGEFCYVLTSRQMGKSSLMVRTAMRPRLPAAPLSLRKIASRTAITTGVLIDERGVAHPHGRRGLAGVAWRAHERRGLEPFLEPRGTL
jgi:hypothetical protein